MTRLFTRTTWLVLLILGGLCPAATAQADQEPSAALPSIRQKGAAGAVVFTENRGQITDAAGMPRPDILFSAASGGARVFLHTTGIHYQFTKTEQRTDGRRRHGNMPGISAQSTHRFTVNLEGANPHPAIRRQDRQRSTENYYLAHCPQGITGVPGYGRVVYENVYPGIDWVLYSTAQGIKYDFKIHPGADYRLIRLRVQDADSVRLSATGGLVMTTSLGEVRESAPVTFSDGRPVASAFTQLRDGTIGFTVGPYDHSKPLTIDPAVVWATYYGGTGYEYGDDCATDSAGNVYLTGITTSTNAIAAGGFQNSYSVSPTGSYDMFLVKFDSSGNRIWGTYYGGTSAEWVNDCAVDRKGRIYLAGGTQGSGLAYNGFQNTPANGYGLLIKFHPDGSRIWATYYGNAVLGCTTDTACNVYAAGDATANSNVGYLGFQNTFSSIPTVFASDAFLGKFDSSGNRIWSTYYGGTNDEHGMSCATDAACNVYLCGKTTSVSGISFNGHQNTHNGGPAPVTADAFLVKFNSTGQRLWATYYGGYLGETGAGCAVDPAGNVFLSGETASLDSISFNGFQAAMAGTNSQGLAGDLYLVKFSASGTRLWATYFGGTHDELIGRVATDPFGNALISGYTYSAGLGLHSLTTPLMGAPDGLMAKFSPQGYRLWSTYYGSTHADYGEFCHADSRGNCYMGGRTISYTGLALNGFQNTSGGSGVSTDAFLVKIRDTGIYTANLPVQLCAGTALQVPFTTTTHPGPGNVYTAQLSDAAGSFAAPVAIGTLATSAFSGTIAALIPANTPPGTGYRVRITGSAPLITGVNNGININILNIPPVPGPIGGLTPACAGTAQTYTITPVAGATSYTWTLPPTWTGSSTGTSINAVTGSTGGTLSVTATNVCGTSAAATLPVVSGTTVLYTPSVSIVFNDTVYCTNKPATFTATPVNGGTSPVYQWKKNGQNVGTNAATYTDPTPQTGAVITVALTSNLPCAAPGAFTSNAITETLTPGTTAGITISASPSGPVCAGTPIQFTGTITGGGTAPQYAWFVNGQAVPGASSANFTGYVLQNNDSVQAFLISSDVCPVLPAFGSNRLGVTAVPIAQPTITIAVFPGATGLLLGTPLTFTAQFTGGGSNPVLTWTNNGQIIAGETAPDFYTLFYPGAVAPGDQIGVEMISSDTCAVPSYASSTVTMGAALGVSEVGNKNGLRIFPNPTQGRFMLEGRTSVRTMLQIRLLNTLGQEVYATEATAGGGHFAVPVTPGKDLPNGLYQVRISAGEWQAAGAVVLQR